MTKKQIFSFFIVFLVGFLISVMPHSPIIPNQGWNLFALFVATILAIILKPLPTGAISIISIAIATLTGILSLEESLAGFHSDIVWLVVLAFFISRGFIKTGLGTRIAYYFISFFGKKTIGLSYGFLASELILAPAIPSITARSGGVIYPIILGLSRSFGSDPKHHTERLMGSFLMKVAYQGSVISSAMFLTGMAANPFLMGLTRDAGFNVSWGTWALAAVLPGLLSLAVMPLIIYKLYPPTIKDTPHASAMAKKHLQEMGRLSSKESLMLFVFVVLLFLWIVGGCFGIKATVAALVGLSLLLLLKVLDWHDVLKEENAWDTFIWFATLIVLASALNKYGFTPWLSGQIVTLVGGLHWGTAFTILALIYFYAHYFFASNTAHVGAMYPAFLMVAIGFGTPPLLAILALAFCSNFCGGLTHYGSGPAPLYYGSGYVDIKSWWKIGFIVSISNLIIWLGLGSIWWKALGLW